MKKIIPLLVSALMLLSLAACGSKTTAPETTAAPAAGGRGAESWRCGRGPRS